MRYLTVLIAIFIIIGFTVTPIAAAESGGTKIGYRYDIHTTPAPPELYDGYSKNFGIESAEHVLYKDLVASVPSPTEYVAVTSAGIIDYLQKRPDITEWRNGNRMFSATEIIDYMQNHPDFMLYAPSSMLDDNADSHVDISGKVVTVTADDITDYLQNYPAEFMGGSYNGQSFTADDINNYLQNHPDFAIGIYAASMSDDPHSDDIHKLNGIYDMPFDDEDMVSGFCITYLLASSIVAIASIIIGEAELLAVAIAFGFTAGFVAAFVVLGIMMVIDIIYLICKSCDNGWEQVLVIPVLFALGTIIGSKRGLIVKGRHLQQ